MKFEHDTINSKARAVGFAPPLTIKEAADALSISRTAVYEILARGEMTALKLMNKTMIRPEEIERYFATTPAAFRAR